MALVQPTPINVTNQKLFDFLTNYSDIARLISDFIFVDKNKITFIHKPYNSGDINYKNSYQIGLKMQNYYLSRICKQNGMHRYYLTSYTIETCCTGCGEYNCSSRYCRGSFYDEYTYKSKYIGKNLSIAVFKFHELAKFTNKIQLIK